MFVDKNNVAQDDLDFPNGGRTIRIVPIIMGSKRAGVLQTILGAFLVVGGVGGNDRASMERWCVERQVFSIGRSPFRQDRLDV